MDSGAGPSGRARRQNSPVLLSFARRMTDAMLAWARALPGSGVFTPGSSPGAYTRNAWIKHALKSQGYARLRATIKLAEAEAMSRENNPFPRKSSYAWWEGAHDHE